jgi:hypothetical protein
MGGQHYLFCINAHLIELLLVVRPGFGAIIRNEDELLA